MGKHFYSNVQTMGNHILFRGVVDGKRVKHRIPYKPRLFTPSQSNNTKYKTLEGTGLEEIKFDSINDHKEFKDKYSDVENFKIYGDIRHEYAFISDTFRGDIEWDLSKLVIAYIDIEVGSENGFPEPDQASEPVTAITIHMAGKFYVFGCGEFKTDRTDVVYTKCEDEKALIRAFVNCWTAHSPDLVTGWNTNQFDFPYIINRMERLFMGRDGEDLVKTLSPWNWIKERNTHIRKKQVQFYDIIGVALIDYLDLYKKFGSASQHESYTLNYIANHEIGAQKIDYSDYEDLFSLYKRNFQLFIEYNIRDVELVMKIEEKTRLLELNLTLAYQSKVNYEDVFSQVRMWDSIICNHLLKKDIILPPKKDVHKKQQFIGAYVKDPKLGMYDWVVSFDFTSLYPHLIMMFNMSPETLVEPVDYPPEIETWMENNRALINVENMLAGKLDTSILKRYQMTLTPNGQLFRTDKHGFLAELMDSMYKDRARYKKLMNGAKKDLENGEDSAECEASISRYNNLQSTMKVCLNSAYGVIGSQFFRFFDVRVAEAVTLSAQLSVIWIQQEMNKFINNRVKTTGDWCIASDTDSVYFTLKPLLQKLLGCKLDKMPTIETIRFIDQMCQQVLTVKINEYCKQLGEYVNCYDQKLDMKREAIADKAIWLKKKHYMINVWNNEGIEYTKPKLKIVGMAAIKSSTPGVCRKKIKEAFEIIINKDQHTLRQYVDAFREEFNRLPVQDIAFPSGMNGLDDYDGGEQIYIVKTPVHVKGALIYNHWLEKQNLTKKYKSIKEGEKLKFVYLREPNPIQSPVISFTTIIPPEFGLDQYIDYSEMFQKTFVGMIEKVTDAIGWKLEEVSSLEGLFG